MTAKHTRPYYVRSVFHREAAAGPFSLHMNPLRLVPVISLWLNSGNAYPPGGLKFPVKFGQTGGGC
jgi:hypothetical protein